MSVGLISLIHGLLCGLVGWIAASVHYGKAPGMEPEEPDSEEPESDYDES